jgi:hypothetical protein
MARDAAMIMNRELAINISGINEMARVSVAGANPGGLTG